MTQSDSSSDARLLLVDDDVELTEILGRFLVGEGFRVDVVHDGREAIDRALAGGYALVLLDVMLDRTNGFDVLRAIRGSSSVPVLMLTAKGDALDRILGLEIGADDYLPKPFNPHELAARIRAVLRRTRRSGSAEAGEPVSIDDLELEPGSRSARRGGQRIDLTTVEFDLLETLVREAGKVITRQTLVMRVLGREFSPFDRSIDTHVYNLRRKLGPLPDGGDRIVGIRGMGYLYACSSRSSSRSG